MTTIHHDEALRDRAAMLALRGLLALRPGIAFDPGARPAFDRLMSRIPAAAGVRHDPATVGTVAGWWCRPAGTGGNAVILYHHGGGYVLGSAAAYRHFVGQIAVRAGMAAFVADYAPAPETPFPAAFDDGMAAYRGLVAEGHRRIILAGDSAGGGLALALLAAVTAAADLPCRPLAAIVVSPWIDLALGSASVETRAEADPLLSREQLARAAASYLRGHDPHDPRVDALAAPMRGLPPVQLHVGEDEILRDDAARYAAALERAGGAAELHAWSGMPHIFPVGVPFLAAAEQALELMGAFARGADEKRDRAGSTNPRDPGLRVRRPKRDVGKPDAGS